MLTCLKNRMPLIPPEHHAEKDKTSNRNYLHAILFESPAFWSRSFSRGLRISSIGPTEKIVTSAASSAGSWFRTGIHGRGVVTKIAVPGCSDSASIGHSGHATATSLRRGPGTRFSAGVHSNAQGSVEHNTNKERCFMIRTFLIVSQSGLVLYNKAVLRPVEQPRLVGSLLTAVMEFAVRHTRRTISQVQFEDMLLTLVASKRARIIAALFQDLTDSFLLGRLVATELLEDFTAMFEDVLSTDWGGLGRAFAEPSNHGRSYTADESLGEFKPGQSAEKTEVRSFAHHARDSSESSRDSPIPRSAPELVHHLVESDARSPGPSLGFVTSAQSPGMASRWMSGGAGHKPPGSASSTMQNFTLLDRFRHFDGAFADAIQRSALSVIGDFRRIRNIKRAILLRGNKVIASDSSVDQVALLANVQFLIDDTERLLMLQGDEMRDVLFESDSGLVLIRRLYVGENDDDETTDTSSVGGLYSVASMDGSSQNSALVLLVVARPGVEASEWQQVDALAKLIEDVATLHANLRIAS
jgi:hypothetical protein